MRRHRHHRRNPALLGFRLEDLAAKAGGAMLTQLINGQFVAPMLSRVIPAQSGRAASALDAATTLASAKVTGLLVGIVEPSFRSDVEDGGSILAAGKAIGVVLPGAGVSATYPNFFGKFGLGGGAPSPTPAMAASARNASTTVALPAAGTTANSQSNYAQPANVADDAGI